MANHHNMWHLCRPVILFTHIYSALLPVILDCVAFIWENETPWCCQLAWFYIFCVKFMPQHWPQRLREHGECRSCCICSRSGRQHDHHLESCHTCVRVHNTEYTSWYPSIIMLRVWVLTISNMKGSMQSLDHPLMVCGYQTCLACLPGDRHHVKGAAKIKFVFVVIYWFDPCCQKAHTSI